MDSTTWQENVSFYFFWSTASEAWSELSSSLHFPLEQIKLFLTHSHSHVAVLLISQLLFGVFPLMGLKHVKTSSKLKFSFKSFQFVYSAIIQCGMVLMFLTSIYNQLSNHIEYTKVGKFNKNSIACYHFDFWLPICLLLINYKSNFLRNANLSSTVKFIFFFLNFLVYFNFTMVARKWPDYVLSFERAERKLMEFHVMQLQDIQLKQKIRRIFVIIMSLAFGE